MLKASTNLEQTRPVENLPLRDHAPTDRLYDENFLLAVAGYTVFSLASALVMAHYSRWIEFLGGTVQQVGWIMGIGSASGLVLRPMAGRWIDRLGARFTWLLAYVLFAAGSLGHVFFAHLGWPVLLLRSCLVFGLAFCLTSGITYVTQAAPPHRRTEAIGILGATGLLGMMVGPVLGDAILGGERTAASFVRLFGSAGLALIVPIASVFFLRPAKARRVSAQETCTLARALRLYWPGAIVFVNVVFGVCLTVPYVFLASYVDQQGLRLAGLSLVGLFFFCYSGWGLLLRIGLRRWPERLGRRKVLLAGMAAMSIGMTCFPCIDATRAWLLVVPALLCGTGHALMFHTMISLTVESFPEPLCGTGTSLALMLVDLGTTLGAVILGSIAQNLGFAWLYPTIGLSCLATAGVYIYSSIPTRRQQLGGAMHEVPFTSLPTQE